MESEAVRAYCLTKVAVELEWPFGPEAAVFEVGSRIFAILAEDIDPRRVSLKVEPEIAPALREAYPAVTPGYHLDKRHWNTVELNGSVPTDALQGWIDDSYDLVVDGLPRYVQKSLGRVPQ